jgi:hypothetical protein
MATAEPDRISVKEDKSGNATTNTTGNTMIAFICEHDAEHFALIEQYFESAE